MPRPLAVLLVEDSEDDALLLARVLKKADYDLTVKRVDTAEAMKMALQEQRWDVVLSDYVMPKFSAPAALKVLKDSGLDLPFIVVSGAMGEDTAVSVMRAGAHDYLVKSNLARLCPAIEREMQEANNRRERRRAQELSMRLGRILDNSSNEIYVFDAATFRFVQVNHGACQNLGYSQQELLERTPLDLQPDMDAHKFAELLSPLYSKERDQVAYETVQRRRNDSTYPIEVQLTLSHSENPPVFVAIAQDITERKQAETVLVFMAEASKVLASTLDYQTIFQSVTRLAVSYLADLSILDLIGEDGKVNRVAVSYGNRIDSGLMRQFGEGYTTSLHKPHPVLNVLKTGHSYVINRVSADGLANAIQNDAYRELLLGLPSASFMAVPLVLREQTLGVISFISTNENRLYDQPDVAIAEELARRATAAIENARLYQEAQQALRLRDQFLSIAAHELKTPLTALLGNTQLIQRRVARTHTFTEREGHVLNVINQQAQRLSRMIEALLDISRIRGGTLSIERDFLDITALVKRLIDEMQPSLERHSIEMHTSNPSITVLGDGLRLEQALQNIIQNAIKYSPEGGKIHLNIAQVGNHACIAVTDQGIGIPAKALPNLFRQFFRADNAQAQQISGMGLGLFVVREIVALHGGHVEVESTEGVGSTFRIYLPLVTDNSGVANQTNKTPKQPNTSGTIDSTNSDAKAFASERRSA
jgi:PAS domain S-box-containing protein